MTDVRPARPGDAAACADIVRALPDHFTDEVARQVADHVSCGDRATVAASGSDLVGFVCVTGRRGEVAQILWAAVAPGQRGGGIGTAMVDAALTELATDGVRLVVVWTLDDSAGYEPYVATRAFWHARGFVQVATVDPVPGWQPGNPAAVLVAALGSTRH